MYFFLIFFFSFGITHYSVDQSEKSREDTQLRDYKKYLLGKKEDIFVRDELAEWSLGQFNLFRSFMIGGYYLFFNGPSGEITKSDVMTGLEKDLFSKS